MPASPETVLCESGDLGLIVTLPIVRLLELGKDKALAETAALLVLSKKLEAIFPRGEDE